MTEQKQPEAAGFLNPFKWGKKKEESKADKAAANPPKVDSTTTTPTPTPPPAAPEPTPVPQARTYTVRAGDTLWDIAVRYYGDGRQYTKIARANNIPDPNMINIGVVLTIPD